MYDLYVFHPRTFASSTLARAEMWWYMYESCHIHVSVIYIPSTNLRLLHFGSCWNVMIYVWVMSHICVSYIYSIHEPSPPPLWLAPKWAEVPSPGAVGDVAYLRRHVCVWVMSHTCMSHVTHMYESCRIHVWVMSHTRCRRFSIPEEACVCMSHVTYMYESCHTYVW
jgi:hypothetical protein